LNKNNKTAKGDLTARMNCGIYKNMLELSRFLGISILMYFDDHNPPHFHVKYNDHRALIAIGDLGLLEGHLPARVLGLVMEWAALHKEELLKWFGL
jgi:hypothetical protein